MADGFLIEVRFDGKIISYSYDSIGNRTSMSDESSSYAYSYDNGNRLTSVTKDGKAYVSYSYDKLGNVTKINGTSYKYDNCNRMISAGDVSYSYYPNGSLKTAAIPAETTDYEYDERNRVTSVVNKVNGKVLSSYAYTYYNNDLEKSRKDNTGKTTSYTYDGAGRLTKAADGTRTAVYTYDGAGNRSSLVETYTSAKTDEIGGSSVTYKSVETAYTYDNASRLTLVTEVYKNGGAENMRKLTRYTFDDAGNQTGTVAEFLAASAGSETVDMAAADYDLVVEVTINNYNGLNQLINTTNIKDGSRTFAEYIYNGDGLRVQKTVDGKTTDYIYSGDYVIEETGKKYLRGLSYHGIAVGTDKYYYFCNAHGDVTGVVDAAKATAVEYDYDEFGNLTYQSKAFDSDVKYAGEFFDSESENYYLRARYYDPSIGRFTQQDTFL